MSAPYEEIVAGETLLRVAPADRHERICLRLHQAIALALADVTSARLLGPRSIMELTTGTLLRPDLCLVTTANNRLLLAAEVISSEDHRTDTVVKKTLYEDANVPRLWMIDSRYDNVEVYHGTEYGLALKTILAGKDTLLEPLLPHLSLAVADLFAD